MATYPPIAEPQRPQAGDSTARVAITRVHGAAASATRDTVSVEEPLEIQLGYGARGHRQVKSISVTMRTPGHDFDLAAGFLMSEGVLSDAGAIERIEYGTPYTVPDHQPATADSMPHEAAGNIVRVELVPDVAVKLSNLQRNFYTTSSCGICGKASLLALQTVCPPRARNIFGIAAETLYALPERLRAAQTGFAETGGIHGAALFDAEGRLQAVREDVGRHNAVDKLLGAEFLADRLPRRDCLLLLSGRASFELLQKALMGGIPMVVAVGAPSSLAIRVAQRFDITLVGFLRDRHCNIYHGAEHISGAPEYGRGLHP